MSNLTVKVTGLKELGKKMNDLGKKTKGRISVDSMRKGAVIIRDKARANAPTLQEKVPHRKRGTLKRAILESTKVDKFGNVHSKIYVRKLRSKTIENFKVKTGKGGAKNPNDPYYWRFIEFGTSKMQARPFLRPAFSTKKNQVSREIINNLRNNIFREAGK
ncbi:MAG: HK97 gp10 family phage protein [Haemophilus parainfluenzae]|nr:HK97 gp10 family phage protein [Haemophilus parainfluenzae]